MAWTRKKGKYSRPRKLHDKVRVEEENELVKKYGLKNKREIWKADAAVARIRRQAKQLITASLEQQEVLFNKLRRMGFKIERIDDVLSLNKEDYLKRRLQSILIGKGIRPKEARQLIAHKHVSIKGERINIPSYIVKVDEEDEIKVDKSVKENAGKVKEEVEKIKAIGKEEKIDKEGGEND